MTPALPAVDPLPLPAPPLLLWFLLVFTFVLHVVPMNLVLGGSIIAAVSRLRGRRDAHAAHLATLVAQALPVLVAAAVTMGVAALLFLQALYGRLFFTAAVLLAVPWLAVVPTLIAGYYAAYAGRTSPRPQFAWCAALAFVAIAFIYANVMGLSLRPEVFLSRFQASASGLHLDGGDPTLAPRFLHVLLASLAVSSLAVAGAGAVVRGRQPEFGGWLLRRGTLAFAVATIPNFVPGVWWLAALPRETLLAFMGRDPGATTCFALGILSSLAAIGFAIPAGSPARQAAAGAPQAAASPRTTLLAAGGSLALSVVFMVLVRDYARSGILRAAGILPPQAVATQWGPIGVFAVLLLAAIGIVAWMVTRLATESRAASLKSQV